MVRLQEVKETKMEILLRLGSRGTEVSQDHRDHQVRLALGFPDQRSAFSAFTLLICDPVSQLCPLVWVCRVL